MHCVHLFPCYVMHVWACICKLNFTNFFLRNAVFSKLRQSVRCTWFFLFRKILLCYWRALVMPFFFLPSLTMLNTQGSFCLPMSFIAQQRSCPKSASRRGVNCRMLDRPESYGTSLGTRAVSRPVANVHRNVTFGGSASTWHPRLTVSSRETVTICGFERLHIGASAKWRTYLL